MKLDTKAMRHLAAEDWRVLTAVEMGSKNHEIVPTPLIEKLARLRGGASGVHKSISNLAKVGLIGRVKESKYDGYRLTYGGLDYLALHTHSSRNDVYSVGSRIGVGKESDIMMVADHKGVQKVLKVHRLGRISFRTVKSNRDYLRNNRKQTGSWMYLSRLAAMKEYAFMTALRDEGFPVPQPISQSRHTIVMEFIDSYPMRQVAAVPDPAGLYAELISLILRLSEHGLIHGDFNEFNILLKEERSSPDPTCAEGTEGELSVTPILIDFPQMVSMDHANAEMYFDRDVNCIKRFFERRYHFVPTEPGPFYKDAKRLVGRDGTRRLDAVLEASGFTKKMAKDLETAIKDQLETNSGRGFSDAEEDEDINELEEDMSEAEISSDNEVDQTSIAAENTAKQGKDSEIPVAIDNLSINNEI